MASGYWVQAGSDWYWYYDDTSRNMDGAHGPYTSQGNGGDPAEQDQMNFTYGFDSGGSPGGQGPAANNNPQPTPGAAYGAQEPQRPAQPAPGPPAAQNQVGTAPPQGTGLTTTQQSAKASLDAFLGGYGLASLGDFAWNEYLQGVPIEQIMLDIRSRPEYKARFPAMEALAQKGHAISEAQYVAYERDAAGILTYAGLGNFATPAYLTSIIANEVSLDELSDRIRGGYEKVIEAPPEVRKQFAEWFGPSGDAALAAWFLDADHTQPDIQKAVKTAMVGGIGDWFGFTQITKTGAEQISYVAQSAEAIIGGFQKAISFKPLTYETISETTDLTQDQTVQAAFGLGGEALDAFQKRLDARAAFSSGGGRAAQSDKGVVGVGSAGQ